MTTKRKTLGKLATIGEVRRETCLEHAGIYVMQKGERSLTFFSMPSVPPFIDKGTGDEIPIPIIPCDYHVHEAAPSYRTGTITTEWWYARGFGTIRLEKWDPATFQRDAIFLDLSAGDREQGTK